MDTNEHEEKLQTGDIIVEDQTKEEQTIYIGPNVPRLGLLRNQVYLRGLPGQVQAAIAKFPEIQEFIVPVADLTFKKHQANTPGEHLHHLYKEFKRKAGVK